MVFHVCVSAYMFVNACYVCACVHMCVCACVYVCMCVADSFLFTSDVFDDDDEVEEVEEGSDEPDSPGFIVRWARGAQRKIRSSLGHSSGTKRYTPTYTGSVLLRPQLGD